MRDGRSRLVVRENSRNTRFVKGPRALLVELSWVSRVALKIYLRYPAWIIADIITAPAWLVLLIFPVLMFLPKSQWSSPLVLNSFLWAMILWDIVSYGLWSFGMAIRREQQMGTLEFIYLTNANRVLIFARNIFARIISLTLTIAYTYVFFKLLFNIQVIIFDPLPVLLVLLLGLFTSMGFGLLYGALVLRFKDAGPLNNILQFIILGISGVFYPVSSLPESLRVVSMILPFTYISEILRYHALGMPTLIPVKCEWIILVLSTLLLNMAGFILLNLIEKNSKKTGELAKY
ncbi:ABC transporter permease [Infirmifilum uzonense]|uniref:ABC transporter permease n=1 Tax=Infirmifilum uzonense TaxID=1550241 RepID=UPI003C78E520